MTIQEAISARHSVRKYLDKEIPADVIVALQDKIVECNKVGNLNIQLVQNETKAFTGMLSYGSFSGVKNYLVIVGKKSKDLDERVGYAFMVQEGCRSFLACTNCREPTEVLV